MLLSSYGIGAIAGAVATAHRGHVPGRGRTLLLALIVYGVATAAAVTSRHQAVAMAFLLVSGFSMVSAFSTVNSLVQENAPAQTMLLTLIQVPTFIFGPKILQKTLQDPFFLYEHYASSQGVPSQGTILPGIPR